MNKTARLIRVHRIVKVAKPAPREQACAAALRVFVAHQYHERKLKR